MLFLCGANRLELVPEATLASKRASKRNYKESVRSMTHRERPAQAKEAHQFLPALALAALCALFCLAPHCAAQTADINQGGPGSSHEGAGTNPRQAQPSTEATAKVAETREAERQHRLEVDAAKLLQLSNELKAEIEKTSKDQLSLDVLRKAEEIEKLARDMKQRVKS